MKRTNCELSVNSDLFCLPVYPGFYHINLAIFNSQFSAGIYSFCRVMPKKGVLSNADNRKAGPDKPCLNELPDFLYQNLSPFVFLFILFFHLSRWVFLYMLCMVNVRLIGIQLNAYRIT